MMPPYREEFTCFSGRMLHLHFLVTIELHPHAYKNHGVHSHWTRQTSPFETTALASPFFVARHSRLIVVGFPQDDLGSFFIFCGLAQLRRDSLPSIWTLIA